MTRKASDASPCTTGESTLILSQASRRVSDIPISPSTQSAALVGSMLQAPKTSAGVSYFPVVSTFAVIAVRR
ncbi:hypothetical protein [Hoeflea sp.]|uniref:hypothetical protein n=1 Tax=Hoeflea sp. TaxID=1940281 RepID=UPI003B01F75B